MPLLNYNGEKARTGAARDKEVAVQRGSTVQRPRDASHALARAARTRRLLWTALSVSAAFNLVFPLWDRWMESKKTAVAILDLASGSLIVSPLVAPASSKELIETMAAWAARALLDRSPAGFDDENTLRIVFLKAALEKAEKEWKDIKDQFLQKSLRQHVEISAIQAQAVSDRVLLVRVEGQMIITGVVNGEATQEAEPLAINFKMARNPDLGRNMRYPLAVFDYEYSKKEPNG
jgi:hypothetical protein